MLLFAHGIVGRADLPIPETLFAAAASGVLVVSFVALALGWSKPQLQARTGRPLPRIPRPVEVVCGAIGVFVFFLAVYAGLFGTDTQSQNLAPTAVYVGFWVGIPFLSLLFGDVFRLFNPWRALGRLTGWITARFGALPEPLEYPARVGRIPAAVWLFAFAICELAWARGTQPGFLAILMLVYLVVMLVGMSLYGVEPWVRNADAFGVLFGLIGTLAPVGEGRLRVPTTATARLTPVVGTAALAVVAVGSTAFDGAKEGALFNGIAKDLQTFFRDLGVPIGLSLELAFVLGLAGACAIVGLIYFLGMRGMTTPAGKTRRELSLAFAHTLIPIAAGYLVAHYFSLLAYNGQDLWRLLSDPLGDGSNWLGAAERDIDYGVVSATGIWYVQVGALVVGHVAALVLAHDRALELYGSARAATRSQVVMLILMVAFTCLGLWLLSAALNA
ncbi:fenitrothion hydrolase [Solirubrobacter sp. CPCC 204708]|uniref:Fenitrothion hydrolase n=1 Tax=Solirubrobacter deserti TaxID=2282478 RepID=A0ABT4RMR8_9ACTN|nr:fenitrothion hydrolase [Solirubrobacter deserti]MBE2320152.1 fenitrothion hydrolase [Solirubrobacter deserti]MDA0139872.1 fenitrothion hydrolase [Solirubrobacter deserti]